MNDRDVNERKHHDLEGPEASASVDHSPCRLAARVIAPSARAPPARDRGRIEDRMQTPRRLRGVERAERRIVGDRPAVLPVAAAPPGTCRRAVDLKAVLTAFGPEEALGSRACERELAAGRGVAELSTVEGASTPCGVGCADDRGRSHGDRGLPGRGGAARTMHDQPPACREGHDRGRGKEDGRAGHASRHSTRPK
jgi:hypothetical protein